MSGDHEGAAHAPAKHDKPKDHAGHAGAHGPTNIEDLLKEAEKREDLVTDYINNYGMVHNEAFSAGIKAIGGKASALKKKENHSKWVDATADFYINSFQQKFNTKLDGEYKDLDREGALHFMSGVTRDVLLQNMLKTLEDQGHYTVMDHDRVKGSHIKQLTERHQNFPLQHIKMDHLKTIVDATKYEGKQDKLDTHKLQNIFNAYRALKKQEESVHKAYTAIKGGD